MDFEEKIRFGLVNLYESEIAVLRGKNDVCSSEGFTEFLAEARTVDPWLYSRLKCEELVDREHFVSEILCHVEDFVENLELSSVVEEGLLPSSLLAAVTQRFQSDSTESAVRVLLRELPFCDCPGWYWKLMLSMEADPINVALRDEIIAPDFKEEYRKHRELFPDGGFNNSFSTFVPAQLPTAERDRDTSNVELIRTEFEKKLDLAHFGEPVEVLTLRPYQEELAKHALQGKNVIICAPTGSGKTWVAVKIIMEHLAKTPKEKRRVAFLVPTVPLVDQQTGVLRTYLQDKYSIGGMSGGETDVNKAAMIFQNDVTVMTPQILLNVVNDPLEGRQLGITQFSLWVFDECHHCDQKHPYNETMVLYHDLRLVTGAPEGEQLPQVVGLTASLGVGNSDTKQMAVDHVIRMAANMGADAISTVYDEKESLEEHVSVPKDVLRQVRASYKQSAFTVHVIDLMKTIEGSLNDVLMKIRSVAGAKDIFQGVPFSPHYDKFSIAYQGWIDLMLNRAAQLHDAEMKSEIITYLQYLRVCYCALDLNAHIPTAQAEQFLEREMEAMNGTTEADMFCQDLYARRSGTLKGVATGGSGIRNAMAEALLEEIRAHYEAEPDSRTIIFVRTRELTRELRNFLLTSDLQRIGPEPLTSVNASTEKDGQSLTEQQAVLRAFREGHCKLLVATSVAEEGLDVEKCNLIIKYNHVSNEIALAQKRGRGRAEGSKSILLAQEGSIADREMNNMLKEKLMRIALELIRNSGSIWFKSQVDKKAKKFCQDRLLQKSLLNEQRKQLGDKKFELDCKKCNAPICDSDGVRTVKAAHYVCVDPEVWSRCVARPLEVVKAVYQVSVAGKITCAKCNSDLGIIIKYCNVFLPTLKADNVGFVEKETSQRRLAKKWKKVVTEYFVVNQISGEDLKRMAKRLTAEVEKAMDKICREAERDQWEQERLRNAEDEEEEQTEQNPQEEE